MKLTPMMQQYYSVKAQYPNTIMFFRLGDFYEMFGEDAKIASGILEIALTSREAGQAGRIPMCGIPHHAAEGYLKKLISQGHRVAICEQLEDPKNAKGVVKRDVVRVVTPATFIEGEMEAAEHRYLATLAYLDENWGLASLDLSTGTFRVTSCKDLPDIVDELARLRPAELILPKDLAQQESLRASDLFKEITIFTLDEQQPSLAESSETLLTHFGVSSLKPFGLNRGVQIVAAGLALNYVQSTQRGLLSHLRTVISYTIEQFLQIDSHSCQNLELLTTMRGGKKAGSLLGVLDFTATSMGARLLRSSIEKPLIDLSEIEERQDAIGFLVEQTILRLELKDLLKEVSDLQRLTGRLVTANGNARDLNSLARSLQQIPGIKKIFGQEAPELLQMLISDLDPLTSFTDLIEKAILDEPALTLRDGNLIQDNFHEELDKLRQASRGGKAWIRNLEKSEREKTGIKSLKVGYNRIFGYYIEVTNPNTHLVPAEYQRKQTLTNAERYITPELKEQEALVLGADERINELEYDIFVDLRVQVANHVEAIQRNAQALANLDFLQSLATGAVQHNFVRPQMFNDSRLKIVQSRHPVIEAMEGRFVPNDVVFGNEQQIILLTGPNMAGKSTYLRQVALSVVLAQMGSFIPAEKAQMGIVDRIFTRIGASDDLSTGQSTFMVECSETAQLLHNATKNSLIILDELGRGTSTFDGMAIAQAVIEHIHEEIQARTLFSTHFHELTKLEKSLKRLVSYRVEVEEKRGQIFFLHRVSRGSTDRSYGINVARMAGMPSMVLKRSLELLQELEAAQRGPLQLDLFQNVSYGTAGLGLTENMEPLPNELERRLLELDLNNLTPLEALQKLVFWQNEVRVKEAKGSESD